MFAFRQSRDKIDYSTRFFPNHKGGMGKFVKELKLAKLGQTKEFKNESGGGERGDELPLSPLKARQ